MKKRCAIKADLFAEQHHLEKIDTLGDPLTDTESAIDLAAPAAEVGVSPASTRWRRMARACALTKHLTGWMSLVFSTTTNHLSQNVNGIRRLHQTEA
jgi:hypothetical protein